RGRRGPRPRAQGSAVAGRGPVAGHRRRGLRPAHRPGLQRAAQGDRGAHRPHRVVALRPHDRGRAAHHPLALSTGHPHHATHRRRGGVPGAHPGSRPRARRQCGASQPGPHRPGTSVGARRDNAEPAATGGADAGSVDVARRLHAGGDQHQRDREGGGRGHHLRSRQPGEAGPRCGVRRRRARSSPAGVLPGAQRAREGPEDPGQASGARRGGPVPDGPDVGLSRRHRPVGRCRWRSRQRRAACRHRADHPAGDTRGAVADDRCDLHRAPTDAGVQRAAAAGAGIDDGGPAAARRSRSM
ncbi:MAG: DNA polymerase III delta prime subunit, partial [uncultured Nocardioides sp.]